MITGLIFSRYEKLWLFYHNFSLIFNCHIGKIEGFEINCYNILPFIKIYKIDISYSMIFRCFLNAFNNSFGASEAALKNLLMLPLRFHSVYALHCRKRKRLLHLGWNHKLCFESKLPFHRFSLMLTRVSLPIWRKYFFYCNFNCFVVQAKTSCHLYNMFRLEITHI